ncbi:hypothetical protein [Rhodopirellula bahusiensis]|uniref:Transposase IS200-like domain-containing protein n=1 Tax=Rhodopirellula bahusiensis TaxID=2014065 RepID=A0A2G1WC49_9BACT|nr:hypothetical protein [Rhodopirellula bahusiensis]PHQ36614.1 hypothetical protein CEE69_04420 [Rhodopirellula bahusiensis]
MNEGKVFRRRNLPHIDVEGKASFITACLDGSLPAAGLKRIRAHRDEFDQRKKPLDLSDADWEMKKHKLLFKLVDSILDGESPVTHLRDDRLAKIVADAFLHFAGERYTLFAFVVMPSHHHWVFLPDPTWAEQFLAQQQDKEKKRTPREGISHSIQSFTGTQCNRARGGEGAFWQAETFDHYARDQEELLRIIHYIEQNPVVAGLVDRAEDFQWSSARIRSKLGIQAGEPVPKVA